MRGRLTASAMVAAAIAIFALSAARQPQEVVELCGIPLSDHEGWELHDEGMFELWFPAGVPEASRGGVDSQGGNWRMVWGKAGYDWGIYSNPLTDLSGPGQGERAISVECAETPSGSTRTVTWTVEGSNEVRVGTYWDNATPGTASDDPYRDRLLISFTLADSTHLPDALSILASVRIRPPEARTAWTSDWKLEEMAPGISEEEIAATRVLMPVGMRVRFSHGSLEWHAGRIGEVDLDDPAGGKVTCRVILPSAPGVGPMQFSRLWRMEVLPEDRVEWVKVDLLLARRGEPEACRTAR